MDRIFIQILNNSIQAGWFVLAILVARPLMKKAPRRYSCVLWGLAAARFVLPISIKSVFSLLPSAETISPDIVYSATPKISSGIPALNTAADAILSESFTPDVAASANPLQIWSFVFAALWLVGAAAMLIYAVVSSLSLVGKLRTAVRDGSGIYISDEIPAPFIFGVFRPRVYLPPDLTDEQRSCVLRHEAAHIKRLDHVWKPVGFLILAVFWFDPLAWLAYALFSRDVEAAADERALRDSDGRERAAYSETLLELGTSKRIFTCPTAFGETGVKSRIKSVLSFKKPALWITIAAIVICAALALCFLTDPVEKIQWAKRPMISMNGSEYADPYAPVKYLPSGYEYAGEITEEQAGETNTANCSYYTDPDHPDDFYVYCDSPVRTAIDTVDSTRSEYAFRLFVKSTPEGEGKRLLTLDDVLYLAGRSDLSWSDFENYQYAETGSGLYIRMYDIDNAFCLMIGGMGVDSDPLYIYLSARPDLEDYIDIRNGDVADFIKTHTVSAADSLLTESEKTYSLTSAIVISRVSDGAIVSITSSEGIFTELSDIVQNGEWSDELPALDPDFEIIVGDSVYTAGSDFSVLVDAAGNRCMMLSDQDSAALSLAAQELLSMQ